MTNGLPATAIPSTEMNVTPMLDVLLVLLIIFMAASIRVYHTMDAQLPQACAGACAGGSSIVLEVLPGPTYRLNRESVAPSALAAKLRSVYDGRPEKIIQIAGYPGVRYEQIVNAMDVARSSGVTVLAVAPRASYLRR